MRAHSSSNVKASIQSFRRLFPALTPQRVTLGMAAGLRNAQASFCTHADTGHGTRLGLDTFSRSNPEATAEMADTGRPRLNVP